MANCFKLDEEIHDLLGNMARASGFSKTQLVEMCILAHAEGIASAAAKVREKIIGHREGTDT